MCTVRPVGRTNIVIDDELVAKAKELYGIETTREVVDFALRRLVGQGSRGGFLALEGTGWDGDLDEMRQTRFPDWLY